MKTHTLIQISRMILLAIAVSFAIMAILYALQHPQIMLTLATIGWNR